MDTRKPLSRRTFLKLTAGTIGAVVAATACGPTPTPTLKPVVPTATTAPKPAAPTATPVPPKTVEIQFWPKMYVTTSIDLWRKATENVMAKKPHLKVVVTSGGDYSTAEEQKLITAMAAGTGPDVWSHGGSSGGFWGAKNVAAALDDMLKTSPLAGDYFDAELMPHTWAGKLYALPWGLRPVPLQWRKDFYKEVGLDPNTPPQTWNELGEFGSKLAIWKGNDIQRIGFGIPANGAHFYFGLFMYEAGGSWFTDDFKRTRINEPPGIEALQFVVDLFHKYKVNATYNITASTPGAPLLVTGQMAMDWVNPNAYFYAKKSRPDLLPQWGAGQPPKGPKSHGQLIFVDTLLVNNTSKVKEAAWEFVQEMMSYENLELLTFEQGFLVPRKSWYDKFPDKVKEDPIIQVGLDALKIAYPVHWGPDWTPFRIALIPFLEEAILLKRSVKEALDAAANKLNTEVLKG